MDNVTLSNTFTPIYLISCELFFVFEDESCGSLVDEMSKAFLGSMGALKVHAECGIGEVRPTPLKVVN